MTRYLDIKKKLTYARHAQEELKGASYYVLMSEPAPSASWDDVEFLLNKLTVAIESLSFYANDIYSSQQHAYLRDMGDKAREALNKIKGDL